MEGGPRRTLRWARVALVAGALMLGAALALTVWDAADDGSPPPAVTGRDG